MMSIASLQKEVLAEAPTESTMTDGVSLPRISYIFRPPLWPSSTTAASSLALTPVLPM